MEDEDFNPFYLKSSAENVIDQFNLNKFVKLNPELEKYVKLNQIELRPLDYTDFKSFCGWIISQQISGRVAELLFQRFMDLVVDVTPKNILITDDKKFREIGLSRSKINYIKNLAEFFQGGKSITNPSNYSSEELRDHYLQIKGVGNWTINMWLIFSQGRLDIAAPKDLVVRKGLAKLYNLDGVPSVKEAERIMDKWQDLGTIGTILSWAVMGE